MKTKELIKKLKSLFKKLGDECVVKGDRGAYDNMVMNSDIELILLLNHAPDIIKALEAGQLLRDYVEGIDVPNSDSEVRTAKVAINLTNSEWRMKRDQAIKHYDEAYD